jgi:RNA polymerase sigma factor (sigma-70 family)
VNEVKGRLFPGVNGVWIDAPEREGEGASALFRETEGRRGRRHGLVSVDWSEVYRATFQDVVRYLHRKVWDVERARDLAQEVFVRALRHEPDEPRAWLFRVAGNLARDEARTVLRRKRHLALLKHDPSRPDASPPPDEGLLSRERWGRVREALDTLAERDRDILLLWDAGLSYREIAGAVDLAPGAVGTTLARARRRLVEAHREMETKMEKENEART